MVALDLSNLKVDSAKLDNITDTQLLALILTVKFLQNLVDRLFLSDDEPHGFLQVHIIFFIFLSLSRLPRMRQVTIVGDSVLPGHFSEIPKRHSLLVIGPDSTAVARLVKETEEGFIAEVGVLIVALNNIDLDAFPEHRMIVCGGAGRLKLVVDTVPIIELLEVVLFILVDIEVLAVEVEQTMGQLGASQRSYDQIRVVLSVAGTKLSTTSFLFTELCLLLFGL